VVLRNGYGFGGTGKKSNSKQFNDYGEPFGKSDVITCLLNLDNGEIKFLKNGSDLGTAFSLSKQAQNCAFFPAVVLKVGKNI
jgi:ATP-dependent RNA helicase DDX1